jgi:hypothetical protein
MSAIEDRHAVFLTGIIPRLDDLAPVMVSEHVPAGRDRARDLAAAGGDTPCE